MLFGGLLSHQGISVTGFEAQGVIVEVGAADLESKVRPKAGINEHLVVTCLEIPSGEKAMLREKGEDFP